MSLELFICTIYFGEDLFMGQFSIRGKKAKNGVTRTHIRYRNSIQMAFFGKKCRKTGGEKSRRRQGQAGRS